MRLQSLALVMLLITALVDALPRWSAPVKPVIENKPVLSYFLLTQSLADVLRLEGGLNQAQLEVARQVARGEANQLRLLEEESLPIILNEGLSLEEKRLRIAEMGYNERVAAIVKGSQESLRLLLSERAYLRLSTWMQSRWEIERSLHGISAMVSDRAPEAAPRSFEIFATRYDAGDRYAVALPDMCLKFSNAGNRLCAEDGYQINQGYAVILSYEGSTGAEVWESGPWNVDDNYWSSLRDPQPRRMFADLPVGMPEAQAAYFDGYNGGVDQYGRTVTAPFGIDLARQVSIDIGLQPGNNDWITVSFMWTDGWGKGSSQVQATVDPNATPVPTQPRVSPLQTATPNPDGSIIHVVQPGQALWNIAEAYGISLQELYTLNGLSDSSVIQPGDNLVIRSAPDTPTPTITATRTPTLPPTPTRRPATLTPEPSATSTPVTPTPEPTSFSFGDIDPLLMFIVGGAVLGVLLLVVGMVFRKR